MQKLSMDELNRVSADEFQPKHEIVIMLDNVRSALNVGSAFRTADAFGLQSLALCGITAQPPHRDILKTALGADESVSWHYFQSSLAALDFYKAQNYLLIGVEQTVSSISLATLKNQLLNELDCKKMPPIVLVFGNEVEGVAQEVLNRCDYAVEIPQFGSKHSLNISVCVGIVAWELVR